MATQEISAAILLSTGVAVMQYGVTTSQSGNYIWGVPIMVIGLGLIVTGIVAIRYNIISFVKNNSKSILAPKLNKCMVT